MSEENTETVYKDGDVVWAKLGTRWWPGEVKDLQNLPEDVAEDLKKIPFAIVKFFEEDSYEYVKNHEHIYFYNCEKKNDFIRKGMDAFRAKLPHMEKFPKDVSAAEVRTGGNPNILSDPIFAPEKKTSYAELVFGTPQKKSSKDSPNAKGRKSTSKSKKTQINITHRRFLGFDDYQSHIRIQFPGKDKEDNPYSSDEDLKDTKQADEETKNFQCTICKFKTDCLEVMVLHNTGHIQGVYTTVNTSKKPRKSLTQKKNKKVTSPKKAVSTTTEVAPPPTSEKKSTESSTIDNDSGLNDDTDTSEEGDKKPKLKRKSLEQTTSVKPAKVMKIKPKTSTEIRYDLLAEWEDFSDGEDANVSNFNLSSSLDDSIIEAIEPVAVPPPPPVIEENVPEEGANNKKVTEEKKSCFDFDEDDELNDTLLSSAAKVSGGRKIPRVIPLVEKRKSMEIEEAEDLSESFSELMEKTLPPSSDIIDNTTLKCEQNFHSAKTIKFPDKPEPQEDTTIDDKQPALPLIEVIATKLTNPKKRFVKSFEDFAQRQAALEASNEPPPPRQQIESLSSKAQIEGEAPPPRKEPFGDIFDSDDDDDDDDSKSGGSSMSEETVEKISDNIEQYSQHGGNNKKSETLIETTTTVCSSKEQEVNDTASRKFVEDMLTNESQEEVTSPPKKVATAINNKNQEETTVLVKIPLIEEEIVAPLVCKIPLKEEEIALVKIPFKEEPVVPKKLVTKEDEIAPMAVDKFPSEIEEIAPVKFDKFTSKGEEKVHEKFGSKDEEEIAPEANDKFFSKEEEIAPITFYKFASKGEEIVPEAVDKLSSNKKEEKVVEKSVSKEEEIASITFDKFTSEKEEIAPEAVDKFLSKKEEKIAPETIDTFFSKKEEIAPMMFDKFASKVEEIAPVTVVKSPSKKEEKVLEESVSKEQEIAPEAIDKFASKEKEIAPEAIDKFFPKKIATIMFDKFASKEEEIAPTMLDKFASKEEEIAPTMFDKFASKEEEIAPTMFDKFASKEEEIAPEKVDKFSSKKEEITFDKFVSPKEEEIAPVAVDNFPDFKEKPTLVKIPLQEEIPAPMVVKIPINLDEIPLPMDLIKTPINLDEIPLPMDLKIDPIKEESPITPKMKGKKTQELKANIVEIKMNQQPSTSSSLGGGSPVKLTTLKSQIMTKLSSSSSTKIHQSPRSKILETYRNECGIKEGNNYTEPPPPPPPPEIFSPDVVSRLETVSSNDNNSPQKNDISKGELVIGEQQELSKMTVVSDFSKGELVIEEPLSKMTTSSSSVVVAPDNEKITENNSVLTSVMSTTTSKSSSFVKVPKMPELNESDLVPIDGNLTKVVSEKDLADGQVEITSNTSAKKNPVTLTNFSMDFSDSGAAPDVIFNNNEKKTVIPSSSNFVSMICDLEEHIPPQIVRAASTSAPLIKKQKIEEDLPIVEKYKNSKLLGKLMEGRKYTAAAPQKKFIVKSAAPSSHNKSVVVKPSQSSPESNVSVQKITTSKRTYQDVEDIDTFIIHKSTKKIITDFSSSTVTQAVAPQVVKVQKQHHGGGKAKILQQTIITPAGEIIQPEQTQIQQHQQEDSAIFDINSMPIVLSDDILTPESIQNMPIVISDSPVRSSTTNKPPTIMKKAIPSTAPIKLLNKSISTPTIIKPKLQRVPQKVLTSATGGRLIKTTHQQQHASTSSSVVSSSPKGKFMIFPQDCANSNHSNTTTKATTIITSKKQPILKRTSTNVGGTMTSTTQALLNQSEPSGNKIMIVTTPQGEQQRLLLTPAQQKMLAQGAKYGKVIKSNVIQKSVLASSSKPQTIYKPPKSASNSSSSSSSQISNSNNSNSQTTTGKNIKIDMKTGKAVQAATPSRGAGGVKAATVPPQKTILFKNQYGQTLKKLQGTDDALLEKQVAEQIEAIKASGMKAQQRQQELLNFKQAAPPPMSSHKTQHSRRSYMKKPDSSKTNVVVKPPPEKPIIPPPLAPISPKKTVEPPAAPATEVQQQRPLNQLVIQDSMGNQTTITEGQILALPSETVDGQPQSYMLVTLDETGNLTPLNSEALMSLDPNLNLGGDLSNMVYQIDQGALTATIPTTPTTTTCAASSTVTNSTTTAAASVRTTLPNTNLKSVETTTSTTATTLETIQPVTCSVSSDPSQQLIVTGDPLATQKFLESLSEGTTDLANILANAEGSSILIHADGQQILINTDAHPDNQNLLLPASDASVNINNNTESGGNPIFSTQPPPKNKDILAAALAGTDVFQQEAVTSSTNKSQLSPGSSSGLYPMNVGNVLETSLTLSSPIMTPLEVPSTNSKKIIPDEDAVDILTKQVPKNVDLPITITDPNISQTVIAQTQQQQQVVASLITTNELNAAALSDDVTTVSSSSNSFVYSLPSTFNSSMPLLTEDDDDNVNNVTEIEKNNEINNSTSSVMPSDGTFMEEEEGLCTLGGEMCTSLSEPPPDMFEIQIESDYTAKSGEDKIVSSGIKERTSPNIMNEDSCEIPVLPQIVTDLSMKEVSVVDSINNIENNATNPESKKCNKFDD